MHSVRTARLVAAKKTPRPATESLEQQDARFAESTLRLFVEAFRAGRDLPNRDTVHKYFYERAKITKKWSEEGVKAWASLKWRNSGGRLSRNSKPSRTIRLWSMLAYYDALVIESRRLPTPP